MKDILQCAWKSLSRKRLRTLLTVSGIMVGAVSYTHLDVYKRQAISKSGISTVLAPTKRACITLSAINPVTAFCTIIRSS